jgi:hypothetical protein
MSILASKEKGLFPIDIKSTCNPGSLTFSYSFIEDLEFLCVSKEAQKVIAIIIYFSKKEENWVGVSKERLQIMFEQQSKRKGDIPLWGDFGGKEILEKGISDLKKEGRSFIYIYDDDKYGEIHFPTSKLTEDIKHFGWEDRA